MLMASFLAIIPLLSVGWLLMDINAKAVESGIKEFHIMLASDLAQAAEFEVERCRTTLQGIAAALTDVGQPEELRLGVALALVSGQGDQRVAIYSATGGLIDQILPQEQATPRAGEFDEQLSAEELREAQKGMLTLPPIAQGARVSFKLLLPLYVGEKLTGFLASTVDLAPLAVRLAELSGAHLRGLPDPLMVVDLKGRLLAQVPGAERELLEPAPLGDLMEGISTEALEAGLTISKLYDSPRGEFVAAAVGLPSLPLLVVVQQPREVAYGSLGVMRVTLIFALTLATFLALFLAIFFSRRLTAPLQSLADFARDLAERRFERRVTINTRDELAILGEAMSTAAADLQNSELRIREELEIRKDLGRYLNADLVDKVVRREQNMALGGCRMPISVLFADVVGFTPLTERLAPEEVVGILNELFTILTEIIFRHGGTVDKFLGDCVMAIWGAPEPQADHAYRALQAAEDIMRWLEIGNVGWRARFGVELQLAVGVNSGEAIVGNVGSEARMEYTAIGDVVNVASRLEMIARPQQILISETTKQAAGDDFEYQDLGLRELAGRAEQLRLYEVKL